MEKLTLTVKEAMEVLGLSRPIIDRYMHRRDNPLPHIKTCAGRGAIVIPRAALEQWLMDEANRGGAAMRR